MNTVGSSDPLQRAAENMEETAVLLTALSTLCGLFSLNRPEACDSSFEKVVSSPEFEKSSEKLKGQKLKGGFVRE